MIGTRVIEKLDHSIEVINKRIAEFDLQERRQKSSCLVNEGDFEFSRQRPAVTGGGEAESKLDKTLKQILLTKDL